MRNQLHALAMGQGICRKGKLWTASDRQELEDLTLVPWASRRRRELLQMQDWLEVPIRALDEAVIQEVERRPAAMRLMEHRGVAPVTALAFVATIGPIDRFRNTKQLLSCLGLNPWESSSGGKQRLGSISKQGNPMLRFLLVEADSTVGFEERVLARGSQRILTRTKRRFTRASSTPKCGEPFAVLYGLAIDTPRNLRKARKIRENRSSTQTPLAQTRS